MYTNTVLTFSLFAQLLMLAELKEAKGAKKQIQVEISPVVMLVLAPPKSLEQSNCDDFLRVFLLAQMHLNFHFSLWFLFHLYPK